MTLDRRLRMDYVIVEGGYEVPEKDVCHHCEELRKAVGQLPKEAEERYSFGIYAGKYCDTCWKKSGYKDEGPEGFDPAYAGECLEAEDY